MKQVVVSGIVLSRVNFGEADRILTVLSDAQGKIRLLAKGVRRVKSKLAGGVELFSVASLTYIDGRGDVKTLISSRLDTHYGHIVADLQRTQFAYEAMKVLNKVVEADADSDYFVLLQKTLAGLDDGGQQWELVAVWFYAQLLNLMGHSPQLHHDRTGQALKAAPGFTFSFDDMAFAPSPHGPFTEQHIKILRLCQGRSELQKLKQVSLPPDCIAELYPLVKAIFAHSSR